MNILGVLCLTAAVFTVNARHKKEWEFLDMKKATREILMPLYRSETPICHKGPGFYRDPNDCHQYIRCVDDFSSGRRLTLFVGRCRPGLVFDENISSCNWPELSAPCSNSPEHFKDTANKINSKEPISQNNKISEESGYWNKYQSQQQKPNKPDQKLQEPKDKIKNVFQETEAQEKIGQSFEDNQESQAQITEQEREPQVAEIPDNNEQQQILITEQVREPVIQENDEVVQQQSEPIAQNPDIREPVIEQQIKESNKAKEPVFQEKIHQVQENPKRRQPIIQDQTQQIQENPKTRQPVTQQNEHVSKNEQNVPINQQQNHKEVPVWEEADSQEKIYQPIQDQENEHVSKNKHKAPINQQQNHEGVPVWDEADSQEKVYQPIQDQEQIRNPVVQDNTQRTNGKQQQSTYDNNLATQFQEQVPSGFFQEIPDSESSQSQWFVPEAESSESTAILGIAESNDKHRGQAVPTTLEEPILCSNEGFFRHPKNCSRFVRCVKNEKGAFNVHFFQCAKHLYFDEKISHCTDSDSVKCPSRRTKRQADDTSLECNQEGFFRHPNDCRSFYRCVKHESGDYNTHLFSCPANLVFDEEYATCNWPDKAPPCDTRKEFWQPTRASTSTPSRPSFKPYQRTTAKGYKTTFKPRNDFIESSNPFTSSRDTSRVRSTQKPKYTTQSPSSFGQLCNSPGFYRHDKDCKKFYKCVKNGNYFVRYELSCPENYAYDEISSRCVTQKYASSCKEIRNPPPFRQNDEEPSTTAESDIKDDEEESTSENDGIECIEAGFFRNPNDCNKFYRCVDFSGEGKEFVRYDFSCPEGLVFDEVKSICNWPDPTAPCEGGAGGGKNEGESNISDEEGESKETSSSTTPSSSTESGRQSTTSKKDKSTSRPRENTRKPEKSTSRPKENTQKPGKSTSKPKESTLEPERGTSKPGKSTPQPEESSNKPVESDNSCSEEGFFRNTEDCNKFYRCVDSSGDGQEFLRYDFDCPEGLVFDETNSVCNWPDASAPCESSGKGGEKSEEESNLPDDEGESDESSTTRKETGKSTSKPSKSTSKPRESTSKPGKSTSKPKEGTSKPGKSTSRPRETTSKPDQSTSRPREGTSKPGKSTSRPAKSTTKPEKSTSSPRERTPQPGISTSKPDESTTKGNENSKEPGESTSNNGCTDNGFFRNPEDCNKFYRCVDFNGDGQEFVRYDFDCPEGLVFDETNSVCNWPSEVDDCSSGSGSGSNKNKKESSTSSTKKGQDSTTTKPTTQKSRGSSTARPSTQKGRESSTAKPNAEKDRGSTTVKPSTEKGQDSTTARPSNTAEEESQTDEDTLSSSVMTEEPEISSSVTESSSTDGENLTPSETKRKDSTNGNCKSEGFFRNPDDCNKFYRCVDYNGDGKEFVKYDFSCPDGLVFDEENSVCNWPDQAAPCEGNSDEKGSTTQNEENESSTSLTTSKKESTISTTRNKEDETPTTSATTKRKESSTTRGTTKSPSNKTTKRPESTKYPSDKTTRRPQSTRSTTVPQSTTSSEKSTGSSTASNKKETTKDQTSENTKQESNGECSEEGFFRNPDDCGKFYRCVDFNGEGQEFVKYDFDCPDGLYFDEINSVCNWPEQSPPCETGTGTSGGKGKATESSSTTSKTDSTTKESQSESTKQSGESTSTTNAGSTTESTTDSNESSSTNKDESSTSGKESDCTEEGFFRCKDDCNKFYRCIDDGKKFVRYDFNCPEGLIFDDTNKKCDFPSEELSCDIESTSTTASSKQSTTQAPTQTTGSESSSGSTTSSESSTKTSKECTEEGYFRDPDDCSKYYRCLDEGDGTLTREEFSCAEDEVFDEEMRYCNRKDLAPPCEQGTTSTGSQSTASSGSTPSSESSETTSSSSTTPGESTMKESKQSGCKKEGFFRCEEDCNRFYRCIDEDGNKNFKRYNFSCPEGLIFDEKNERCDWPSVELTCDIEITGSSTTSRGPSTSRGSTTEATSSGITSSTTSSGSTSSECTEEGYFRNPDDCSKYYRCLDEGDGTLTREDFSCSEDEVFDDEMNYCNRKDLAPPCEESSSSTTGSSTSTTQSGSTNTESESSTTESGSSTTSSKTSTQTSTTTKSNESTTNEENGSTKGTSEGSTKSSAESGECEEEGFHRHSDDCNKFYRCVDFAGDGQSFTRYDFECPEGLVFDETNNVCNWPSSVPSCESSDKKSTTSSDAEETSTTNETTTTSTTQSEQSTTTKNSESTESSTTKKDSSSTGTPSGSTTEDIEGTDSSTTSSGTTSSTGSTKSDKKAEDAECTEEGFFRNPDDCAKFYRCVDFAGTGESYTRYDFECPDDLVFDDVNNVCNWPNMSPGCESRSKNEKKEPTSTTTTKEASNSTTESTINTEESESTDTTVGSNTGTTSDDSTTEGESTGTTSGGSKTEGDVTGTTPRDSTTSTSSTRGTSTNSETESDEFQCKDEGFFRHPKNCKKYYECKRDEDSGELIKIDCECPEGHVFDEEGWYCNAEELSPPCDDGSFKCEQEGFFRDPEDCTKYYSCNQTGSGFKKESFQCSDGHVFDEEGWYCNAPELTEPCNNTSTTSSSSSGTTSLDQSTTPGSETSSKSTSTTSSETSSTSGSSTSSGQQDCTEEGFFRNPEDCNKYYQCTRSEESGELERQDFTCPDGRVFDEEGNYCNDPELADKPCESSSTSSSTQGQTDSTTSSGRSTTEKTSTTDSTSTEGTESSKTTTDSTPTESTDSSKTTTKESSTTARTDTSSSSTTADGSSGTRRGGGEPECTEAGFFRNPKDCNKFYRCVDFAGTGESFVRFDFDCPEGLHFDEVNSTCNWPTMSPRCESESE